MQKALIIDDERLARNELKKLLLEFPEIEVVGEAANATEGLEKIENLSPDLIFLDIQMPKINGFEMLELVDQPPAIIFTTAFDEYAIKAFENHAVDYLLKPFSKERFSKAIQKWLDQQNNSANVAATKSLLETASESPVQSHRVVVKTGTKIRIIPIDEILYLEAADDYVKIHTKDGSFLKNKTMSHFEKVLDDQQFVRTHRSYIVNVKEITRLEPYEKENFLAILKAGVQVPVSKNGYPKLKAVLGL